MSVMDERVRNGDRRMYGDMPRRIAAGRWNGFVKVRGVLARVGVKVGGMWIGEGDSFFPAGEEEGEECEARDI